MILEELRVSLYFRYIWTDKSERRTVRFNNEQQHINNLEDVIVHLDKTTQTF